MFSIPKFSKSFSNSRGTYAARWRTCVFWLMCISLWRGPIPVVHQHSLDLQSLSNNCRLAEHALEFHSEHLGESDSGMHLHIVLCDASASLFADVCDCELQGDGGACWDAAFAGSVLHQAGEKSASQNFAMDWLQDAGGPALPYLVIPLPTKHLNLAAAPSGFFQSHLEHAPACSLFGVFLC